MRKIITAVVMALTLAGCNLHLNGRDVETAVEYCKDKGGVYSITLLLEDTVTCARSQQASLLRAVRDELGATSAPDTEEQ